MTPAQCLASHRAMIGKVGQSVAIRRYSGLGPARSFIDTATQAYVRAYDSKELIGSIVQGDQIAIALVDTLSAILPVTVDDKLAVGVSEYAIRNVRPRVVAGVLIALEIHATG